MLHLWLTEQPGYGANAPSATPALHFSVVTSKAASLPMYLPPHWSPPRPLRLSASSVHIAAWGHYKSCLNSGEVENVGVLARLASPIRKNNHNLQGAN